MKKKKVLFVAVHPDDETLACGGTILRHKAEGDEIYWMLITNIHTGNEYDEEIVASRQIEIEQVAKEYRFDKIFKLDFPTTRLDEIPRGDIVKAISKVVQEIMPDVIYLPNRGDVHSDHSIAFQAAYSCTKNFRYPSIKRILMMETLSETEFAPPLIESAFIPNVFIDISDYIDKKIEIMKIYKGELMPSPLPRSINTIKSLAAFRGSSISANYAEAFMLLKEIY